MADLLQVTGCKTLYSLALTLDPESVWRDAANSGHLSKWYLFDQGRIPRRDFVTRIASKARTASFDVLHPVWQYLRSPGLSPRSVRRLRASMGDAWLRAFRALLTTSAEQLRFCPPLVEWLGLASMPFWDALMLFALARDERLAGCDDPDLEAAFAALLLVLPLLYAFERLWGISRSDAAASTTRHLNILDRCLKLNTGQPNQPCFPVAERAEAVNWLRWQMELRRRLHRRSLSTPASCMRLTMEFLGPRSADTVRFALSPYRSGDALPAARFVGKPVDEPAWCWAWHNMALGRYPAVADSYEVERIWQTRLRRKGSA